MRRYPVSQLGNVIVLMSVAFFIISLLIWTEHRRFVFASPLTQAPLAIDDPIDCNINSNFFVGIDTSQGQDPNDASSFLNDLESDGFEIGTFDLANGIPSCLDVIMVFGLANGNQLGSAYSASQGTTLLNWVNNGGGLMLFGEWGFLKAETEPLFQAFGYSQQGDDAGVVSDPTDADPLAPAIVGDTWVIYQGDNFSAHPAFNGVSAIELLRSSWLNSSANTIVQTDADAVPASEPVMAAQVQGSGCLLLSADSNWVGEIDAAYQKEDNALFARQMVSWLTGCTTLTLFKQADRSSVGIGEQITFTITASNNEETAVTNTIITDTIPAGTTFVAASTPFTGPDVNGVVSWNVGALAAGEQTAVTLTVQVNNGNSNPTVENTAWVQTAQGDNLSASSIVAIVDDVPIASAGGNYSVPEGSTIQLNGTNSSSAGGTLTFAWDFDNDGQFDDATGPTPQFSAALLDNGQFPIALQVEDGDGDTAVDNTTLTVTNVSPQVTLTPNALTSTVGTPVNFTGSFIDPGSQDTHTISWDFGDSVTLQNSTLDIAHTFSNPGVYTVQLTVNDDDEGTGQDSKNITILSLEGMLNLYLPAVTNNYCLPGGNNSDVVLVIDVSGSMNDPTNPGDPSKLEVAKESAIEFINLLDFPNDQASVVTFGSNAQLIHPLSSDSSSLINAINAITSFGASRIDLGISVSHDELNSPSHEPTNQKIMIILSDGHPSEVTDTEVLMAANAAKADGVEIYTIGLGNDVNGSLMQSIATSDEHYFFSPSTNNLNKIYEQIASVLICN